jgi:hypothetical protein
MGIILVDQQAVIDCLNNTAKYYEREDADEWTKGIHYGLLHGVDNILDDVKPVEAITKDQYDVRLKAEMIAILEEIKTGINYEFHDDGGYYADKDEVDIYIQQKIDKLKEGLNDYIRQKLDKLKESKE